MGLAASQARLLFITLRQNDVSAQMQRVSHDTIALARDKDIVAEKYEQMQTQKSYKLKEGIDLSYNSLMGAGAAQNGNLGVITDSAGRVVLTNDLASTFDLSASGSGADFKAQTGCDSRVAFVSKMMGISNDVAAELVGTKPANDSPKSSVSFSINDVLGLMSSGNSVELTIDASGTSSMSGTGVTKSNLINSALFGDTNSHNIASTFNKLIGHEYTNVRSNNDGSVYGMWGKSIGSDGQGRDTTNNTFSVGSKSIKDLYNSAGKFESSLYLGSIKRNTDWKSKPDFSVAIGNFKNFVNGISSTLINSLVSCGLDEKAVTSLVNNVGSGMTSDWTSNQNWDSNFYTSAAGKHGNSWNDQCFDNNEDSLGAAMSACRGVKGIVAAANEDGASSLGGQTWDFTVDAGTFVKDMIDSIMARLTDGESQTQQATGDTVTNPNKSCSINVKYITSTETKEPETADDVTKNQANYYAKLFDNLSSSGWVTDDSIKDRSTLNEKLTNQTYYVNGTSINNTDSSLYEEDKTVDNSAKAEAYWKVEMEKISTKEKKLETELTKLQTEYSSLTSDYESVNSIIQKNVSRSFTYCQNG